MTAIATKISAGPDLEMAVTIRGTGQPVVLLHGIPGSGRVWDRVAERLGQQCRVVVPDLLGFGASAKPVDVETLWATGQARALAQVLTALGIDRAAIVGHDFGGPTALAYATEFPDRVTHLVLAATNAFPDTPIPFPLSAVTWPALGPLTARALFSRPALRLMLWQGAGRPRTALSPATYLGDPEQLRSTRLIFATGLRELADRYAPCARALSRITVPTLVIWGDGDPFFPVAQGERTADDIPGARFVVYEGAGHFLPEERPAQMAAAIAELIGAPLPGASGE
ncbi:alpha/beta fold hydrolase [Streptomyces sp. KR80]|uniref:alpha/beta fold hydrolase n=1 Tax=Streptomyces sp. KR80 TaxID=3457426 RepID=UPI003FD21C86